jgi:hypothetical protein
MSSAGGRGCGGSWGWMPCGPTKESPHLAGIAPTRAMMSWLDPVGQSEPHGQVEFQASIIWRSRKSSRVASRRRQATARGLLRVMSTGRSDIDEGNARPEDSPMCFEEEHHNGLAQRGDIAPSGTGDGSGPFVRAGGDRSWPGGWCRARRAAS